MGEAARQPESLLEAVELTKRFGALVANDHVSLAIRAGETHALLGENGAGKSTLVKMMCGLLQADSGELLYEGTPIVFPDPASSRAKGVGVVFQHFALFDAMTVVENVALGLPGHQPLSVLRRPHPRLRAPLWPCRRALSPRRRTLRRRAPAGGNRPLPARRPARADPRRADLGAHPGRIGKPVPHRRRAHRRGPGGAVHQPQAGRGAPALPPRPPCCAAASSSPRSIPSANPPPASPG